MHDELMNNLLLGEGVIGDFIFIAEVLPTQ